MKIKKSHQKFLPLKWKFFHKKRHLGRRKIFRSPQTRRQVSATATAVCERSLILYNLLSDLICLSVCPFGRPSVNLISIRLFACLSVCHFVCLNFCFFVRLILYCLLNLGLCICVHLSFCPSARRSV